jgi:DNA-directed RNA polymerase subunit N (RpoN/RPB10)
MLVPVLCFTCGCPVGDVEDIFREMRISKVRAILDERGTTATQAAADAGLQIDCSDILKQLGIEFDCCRKTIISAMIFTDYY